MVHIRDLIAFMAARAALDPAAAEQHERPHRPISNFANIDLSMPLAAAKIVREILYAPPSMPALDLLAKMQATRIHLALVIDEYGGTDGLVSIEDLVELIVGDIADEHDEDEMPGRHAAGRRLVPGQRPRQPRRRARGDRRRVRRRRSRARGRHARRLSGHPRRPCAGARRTGAGTGAVRGRSARCRSAPGQAGADLSAQGPPARRRARRCRAAATRRRARHRRATSRPAEPEPPRTP